MHVVHWRDNSKHGATSYPTKQKRINTVGFSIFRSWIKFCSAILSLHFGSPINYQFIPENLIDLIQIEDSNQSSNKEGVKIECHNCFNMKYGHHQCADTLCTVDAPDIKRNTCSKIFPFSLLFLSVKITINKAVNGLLLIWRGW